jgi:hypothetical protein
MLTYFKIKSIVFRLFVSKISTEGDADARSF